MQIYKLGKLTRRKKPSEKINSEKLVWQGCTQDFFSTGFGHPLEKNLNQ